MLTRTKAGGCRRYRDRHRVGRRRVEGVRRRRKQQWRTSNHPYWSAPTASGVRVAHAVGTAGASTSLADARRRARSTCSHCGKAPLALSSRCSRHRRSPWWRPGVFTGSRPVAGRTCRDVGVGADARRKSDRRRCLLALLLMVTAPVRVARRGRGERDGHRAGGADRRVEQLFV